MSGGLRPTAPDPEGPSWAQGPPVRALRAVWRWATTTRAGTVDLGLLLLRLAAGGMMLTGHGWGKLLSYPEKAATWADPLGLSSPVSLALATGAEFVCAGLVAVGLGTRLAAIPVAFTMLVAAGVVHWDDPFGRKELPLLYLSAFVALALAGGGRHSVDGWLERRRRS